MLLKDLLDIALLVKGDYLYGLVIANLNLKVKVTLFKVCYREALVQSLF